LGWGVRLMLRATGGLPLLGGVAAVVLALRHRRWRHLLVVVLPVGILIAGLAWSHPPSDWGARRFYLFLVPLCVVPTLLLGRVMVVRWLPPSRMVAPSLALLVIAGSLAHGVLEIRSFRAPQLESLLVLDSDAPRGVAGAYDRRVVAHAAHLGASLDACAPVATNFHGVATAYRLAFFLGDVPLDAAPLWPEAVPETVGDRLWLVQVPPGGEAMPTMVEILRHGDAKPLLREGP
jgi:hypothetical protein